MSRLGFVAWAVFWQFPTAGVAAALGAGAPWPVWLLLPWALLLSAVMTMPPAKESR